MTLGPINNAAEGTDPTRGNPSPAAEPIPADDDNLDLDLEELGDGDRLKEGFTGQER